MAAFESLRTLAKGAVAVYCGASLGTQTAYHSAALSLGTKLAKDGRPLIYGGGSKGIMGIVSMAALQGNGEVIGIVPDAMLKAGGEGEHVKSPLHVQLNEKGREAVQTIVVKSMHERKVRMADHSVGFIGLPGGFGTFEELLEVTTWTQLGIHNKPVILLNVLGFWDPLRHLIQKAIEDGFVQPRNASLITFVDGPKDYREHETFDWGGGALEALKRWDKSKPFTLPYNWART